MWMGEEGKSGSPYEGNMWTLTNGNTTVEGHNSREADTTLSIRVIYAFASKKTILIEIDRESLTVIWDELISVLFVHLDIVKWNLAPPDSSSSSHHWLIFTLGGVLDGANSSIPRPGISGHIWDPISAHNWPISGERRRLILLETRNPTAVTNWQRTKCLQPFAEAGSWILQIQLFQIFTDIWILKVDIWTKLVQILSSRNPWCPLKNLNVLFKEALTGYLETLKVL